MEASRIYRANSLSASHVFIRMSSRWLQDQRTVSIETFKRLREHGGGTAVDAFRQRHRS